MYYELTSVLLNKEVYILYELLIVYNVMTLQMVTNSLLTFHEDMATLGGGNSVAQQ